MSVGSPQRWAASPGGHLLTQVDRQVASEGFTAFKGGVQAQRARAPVLLPTSLSLQSFLARSRILVSVCGTSARMCELMNSPLRSVGRSCLSKRPKEISIQTLISLHVTLRNSIFPSKVIVATNQTEDRFALLTLEEQHA